MYCYLCEEYIGLLSSGRYCNICRSTKNIQRVYGKEEVLKILENVCLRDGEKRDNKINYAIKSGCYSPSCKTYDLRSKKPLKKTKSNSELDTKKE